MWASQMASGAMTELTDEGRRLLKQLARSPDGCTEAMMMARGFGTKVLAGLVLGGLTTSAQKAVPPPAADTGRLSGYGLLTLGERPSRSIRASPPAFNRCQS
jgi:hypothetical protein